MEQEAKFDNMGNLLTSRDVFIVKQGLIGNAWCCAPKGMTVEQVQDAVNKQCEPYLPDTPWTVTSREHQDEMLISPGFCAECPDEREHWFMLGGLSGVLLLSFSKDTDGFPADLQIRTEA